MEDFGLMITEAIKHEDLTDIDPYLKFKFAALIHIRYGNIDPYFKFELEKALINHLRRLEKEIREMGNDPTIPDKDWFEDHGINQDKSVHKGLWNDREKIRSFIAAVNKFEDKPGGTAPKYAVFNELLKHEILEEEAQEILKILKSKNILYEPQKGYLKLG